MVLDAKGGTRIRVNSDFRFSLRWSFGEIQKWSSVNYHWPKKSTSLIEASRCLGAIDNAGKFVVFVLSFLSSKLILYLIYAETPSDWSGSCCIKYLLLNSIYIMRFGQDECNWSRNGWWSDRDHQCPLRSSPKLRGPRACRSSWGSHKSPSQEQWPW